MTGRKKNLNPTKQEELEIFENCWLQRREQAITAYFQKRAKRRPIQSQVGKKNHSFTIHQFIEHRARYHTWFGGYRAGFDFASQGIYCFTEGDRKVNKALRHAIRTELQVRMRN